MLGATHFVASKSSLSPLIIQLSSKIKHVYLADYFLDSSDQRDKEARFEKAENQIWWSNEFKNKTEDFKSCGIDFHVLNYKSYIAKFNASNYDSIHPVN